MISLRTFCEDLIFEINVLVDGIVSKIKDLVYGIGKKNSEDLISDQFVMLGFFLLMIFLPGD